MPERMGFSPEAEQHSEENEIDRRSFLKKMGGIAAGLTLSGKLANAEKKFSAEPSVPKETSEVNNERSYPAGKLEGRTFPKGSLFHYFTGISGKVPASISVNYRHQLEFLFAKKEEFVQKHNKSNSAFKSSETQLLKEYAAKSPERESFAKYQNDVEIAIHQIDKNIDWEKVGDLMNLDDEQVKLLKAIISALGPKHLTAYAMTELMPSADGELNKEVYEFLLKTAGSRYVYSIPAIFDDRLSFGPYQFTSGALMDLGDGHPVGASKINHALPEKHQIPASVASLRGLSHHKAALLFAIHNTAFWLNRLNSKQLRTLKGNWHNNVVGITQFIATAHHLPGAAYEAGERWLDGNTHHPFEVSCGKSIHEYAIKTKANLTAI